MTFRFNASNAKDSTPTSTVYIFRNNNNCGERQMFSVISMAAVATFKKDGLKREKKDMKIV